MQRLLSSYTMMFQRLHDTMEGGILYSDAYLESSRTSTMEFF